MGIQLNAQILTKTLYVHLDMLFHASQSDQTNHICALNDPTSKNQILLLHHSMDQLYFCKTKIIFVHFLKFEYSSFIFVVRNQSTGKQIHTTRFRTDWTCQSRPIEVLAKISISIQFDIQELNLLSATFPTFQQKENFT